MGERVLEGGEQLGEQGRKVQQAQGERRVGPHTAAALRPQGRSLAAAAQTGKAIARPRSSRLEGAEGGMGVAGVGG